MLRDKVVLVNFIFTQCTDSCPTQTARLAAVQPLLPNAAKLGIELASISVDPEHDTRRRSENMPRASGFMTDGRS